MSDYQTPKMPPDAQRISKRAGVQVDGVEDVIDIMRIYIAGTSDLTITEDMVMGWILCEMYYGERGWKEK